MQNENVDGRNITVVVVVILEYFRNKVSVPCAQLMFQFRLEFRQV